MAPFCECGSTASRLHSHYDEILLCNTKFPEILGTH